MNRREEGEGGMCGEKSMLTISESVAIPGTSNILDDARAIIDASQIAARTAVNVALVQRNWLLGKRIAEEELHGGGRRETYGREIVQMLSKELSSQYGKGFSATNLWYYVQFYKSFPNILHAVSGESRQLLSWTHYRTLLRVEDKAARDWYEREACEQMWSARTLDRNISTQYYYRLLKTPKSDRAGVAGEMEGNTAIYQNHRLEFIKDPVIAEFLGFKADESLYESDLEGAIINNLQKFLLELGKGYAFVARQQHIRTDIDDFYIDLVFYNIILKCYVLIDLKVGRITPQDVGQMDMYVRMYDDLKRGEDDNPTLGIVLCSETSETVAKYSMLKGSEQLFASKYRLVLPSEEELRAEIETQRALFEIQEKARLANEETSADR